MKDKTNSILVVDDEIEIQRLLQQRFRKQIRAGELSFQFARNGAEALQILRDSSDIDMVLTDIRMPEMDGLTLLANLADLETPLKSVVVSAYGDMGNIRTAMNQGAFDFLTKPIDFADLEITINKTLRFVSKLRSQQKQLQEAQDRLYNLVFYDQLTELPNHNGLVRKIIHSIDKKQTQGHEFALLMFDIERYSTIKSGFGHVLSDRLITEVSRRLKQAINTDEFIARIGESTFAILWHSLQDLDRVKDKVEGLLQLLNEPLQLNDVTIFSSNRVGIALSNLSYNQPEAIIQAADTALQIAKKHTKNEVVTFETHMQELAAQRLNLEVDLQQAIETQQLSLYYQPIFRLDTRKIISFETLVRWKHPSRGHIPPLKFIPLAEETGLIVPLGEWIIAESCQQLKRWKVEFGVASPTSVSVNISSLQLQNPTFLNHIYQSLESANLTGYDLHLEITESVLMENMQEATKLLVQLQEYGIQLSIDDFGTGYSSLAYLQRLPISTLKIDRAFVKNIEANKTNFDITSTIINLAHHLGFETVAEGLEKEEQLNILGALDCQYGQGFVFSHPLSAKDATALIKQKNNK